jgi:hypothetical protein
MSNIIAPNGRAIVVVPSGESIAVFTQGQAQVSRTLGFPNYPDQTTLVGTVTNGQTVFGAFASGATIVVESVSAIPVYYEVGAAPVVQQGRLSAVVQVAPTEITDGGAMQATAAALLTGIVVATPSQARNVALPTGSSLDLASEFLVNDSIDWSVITLAAFALTMTASAGHTIVGAAATAATIGSVARFRTRKFATDTFISYRIS